MIIMAERLMMEFVPGPETKIMMQAEIITNLQETLESIMYAIETVNDPPIKGHIRRSPDEIAEVVWKAAKYRRVVPEGFFHDEDFEFEDGVN